MKTDKVPAFLKLKSGGWDGGFEMRVWSLEARVQCLPFTQCYRKLKVGLIRGPVGSDVHIRKISLVAEWNTECCRMRWGQGASQKNG